MRPWTYIIVTYDDGIDFEANGYREILKMFLIHQNPTYLNAKSIISTYEEQALNNPHMLYYDSLVMESAKYNARSIMSELYSGCDINVPHGTCLTRLN